ncbi:phage integrase SAM-like domain-containing protein [Runella sp. MFBS21]|uniref:phage integrase SAM-like domain-containing protein n=1 Tax=Runella sp. MFBS21 TaxID=3034018 RepID=UPI0023F83DF6|nr:phage integrase SAM-like domain-containing protein [Runella sp. MFBS21]MDF7818069.1 phage integrase SAM-like domain-containing protein [Runella sp. MFBS21]
MRIRFWTRIDSINEAGQAPLNCYVIVNKVKCPDFSVDLMIPVEAWDSKKQQVNEWHSLASVLNQKINFIRIRLMQIEMQLSLQGEVTAKMVKEKFFDEYKNKKKETIVKADKFLLIDELPLFYKEARQPLGISNNTGKNDNSIITNIKQFLKETDRLKIEVGQVDLEFVKYFNLYMKKRKKPAQQVHINRHVAYLRQMLDFSVSEKKIKYNPLAGLRLACNYEENPEGFEPDDIQKIKDISRHFMSELQVKVRDIFLFMMGTGMDFCDYQQRTDQDLYREKSFYWLKYTRQKTITYKRPKGLMADTMLLPDAVEVMLNYGSLSAMPDCTLNEFNEQIKAIYKLSNIRRRDLEKISSKLCRKTYANLQSNYQGFSDESVAYLMGHTTTKHIKKYRKYKKQRVLNELKK